MSDDPNKTDPGWQSKVKDATAKADPFFDRALRSVADSEATPWVIIAFVLALIGFGIWLAL